MKWCRRSQRISILVLLSLSVFAPLVFVSRKLNGGERFNELDDLLNIVQKKAELLPLHAVGKESSEDLTEVTEPRHEVYRDQNLTIGSNEQSVRGQVSGFDGLRSTGDQEMTSEPKRTANELSVTEETKPIQPKEKNRNNKGRSNEKYSQHDHAVRPQHLIVAARGRGSRSHTRRITDVRVKQMTDQVIRAKAYLSFITSSNTHLAKELRLRIKETERALGEAVKDSDLSRSAPQKIKMMESTLSKASRAYPDCSNMVTKLHIMMHNAEDQVQSSRTQATFLRELAGRTTPKGLHCLSMRLTTEFFGLQPEEQLFLNQQNIDNPNLFHYVVFSDNVLAAAVVVNSTVSNSLEPERMVFHVVTDSLNFHAISMWFLLNRPGKATIQVMSVTGFHWLSAYESVLDNQSSHDLRRPFLLSHIRFHLPEIFPQLDKIVLLDHDVVVQRDLNSLWDVDMKGKVNGVVETCKREKSPHMRMDMFINFSDPLVAGKFDGDTCTWAFGMNLFDLEQWRRHDLTYTYRRFLLRGNERPIWKAGTLPLGWLTFYNKTIALDRQWDLLGLGFDSQITTEQIEQAAVIHYDGMMKPWLDIGMKYKGYWNKYINFDHPYLQQCNLHEYVDKENEFAQLRPKVSMVPKVGTTRHSLTYCHFPVKEGSSLPYTLQEVLFETGLREFSYQQLPKFDSFATLLSHQYTADHLPVIQTDTT